VSFWGKESGRQSNTLKPSGTFVKRGLVFFHRDQGVTKDLGK
jgi:hypothetical protein